MSVGLLSSATRLHLASYREAHVAERVRRALERERMPDERSLARLLAADDAARSRFRRSIAVSVSGPFRDAPQFELLEQELLPVLLADPRRLTAWSAGCADGSELYSIAIVLDRLGALDRSLLLGSDVLEENIAVARAAPVEERFRAWMRWEQRDVVREGAPPGKWRLVLCRNLAIYLAPAAKAALHRTLAGSLAAGGILLLGRSERLGDLGSLGLEAVAPHAYRKAS